AHLMEGAKRILVIDDDPNVCLYLEELVGKLGYGVETALTCREAIARLNESVYDGLLLDIYLEDGRGDEILDWLSSHRRRDPAIMMSGLADYSLLTDVVEKGAADLIPKPIQPSVLRRTLRLIVDQRIRPHRAPNPPPGT
ncbi:MAG: response regulator, partial [bacterium]|nr:response regulator [bacterium]